MIRGRFGEVAGVGVGVGVVVFWVGGLDDYFSV